MLDVRLFARLVVLFQNGVVVYQIEYDRDGILLAKDSTEVLNKIRFQIGRDNQRVQKGTIEARPQFTGCSNHDIFLICLRLRSGGLFIPVQAFRLDPFRLKFPLEKFDLFDAFAQDQKVERVGQNDLYD